MGTTAPESARLDIEFRGRVQGVGFRATAATIVSRYALDGYVVNLRSGQPTLVVTGWAEDRLRTLTPPGHRARLHLTLTDDHPWAMAVVVIEALPE